MGWVRHCLPIPTPFVLSLSKDRKILTMSFWVYILTCNDDSYYTGHTDNLERRIAMHQTGKIDGYTGSRLLIELAFSAHFTTRREALEMERRIKGWSRKKKEAMMRGDWDEVSRLAQNRSQSLMPPQPPGGSTGSPRTVKISAAIPEHFDGSTCSPRTVKTSLARPALFDGSTSSPQTVKVSLARPALFDGSTGSPQTEKKSSSPQTQKISSSPQTEKKSSSPQTEKISSVRPEPVEGQEKQE